MYRESGGSRSGGRLRLGDQEPSGGRRSGGLRLEYRKPDGGRGCWGDEGALVCVPRVGW